MDKVIFIGISVIGLFVLFILRKRDKSPADFWLILLNLLLAGYLFSEYWIQNGLTTTNFVVQTLLSFVLSPALITFSLLWIAPGNRWQWRWSWVWGPALVASAYIVLDITTRSTISQAEIRELYLDPPLSYLVQYKVQQVFGMGMMVWFLTILRQHRSQIKGRYSYIEPIEYRWLRNFTWVYLGLTFFIFVSFFLYNWGLVEDIALVYAGLNLAMVASVCYLSYHGIQQYSFAEFEKRGRSAESSPSVQPLQTSVDTDTSPKELRTNSPQTNTAQKPGPDPEEGPNQGKASSESPLHKHKHPPEKRASSTEAPTSQSTSTHKYASSTLSEADMQALLARIQELFQAERIYLEPQLKIQDLAGRLEVTTHKVSQTLNALAGKSFYDYVNQFRVQHLQDLLLQPQAKQFTILAMGLDSGFNSKASLNRIFKQQTGLSPREFQKSQLQPEGSIPHQ